jgi:Alcohol dehydrogenase GroES-like domain
VGKSDSMSQLVDGLGLFSLGLGTAQLLAPGVVNRLVGADDHAMSRAVMRWLGGAREFAAGVGIESRRRGDLWLWARVVGDMLDLSMLEVQNVPDPKILNSHDAILKITSTAICGSDLHLFNGFIPTMRKGDILGHEFMGEVIETGSSVRKLKVGDRVVVPFPIACGHCSACKRGLTSVCQNSNPNAGMAEKIMGRSPSGIFGYSHMLGGFAGGQAEYARVPFADIGPIKIEDGIPDEQVLFLSDILPGPRHS